MRWRGVLLSLLCLAPLGESIDRLSRFWSANLGAETSPLYKWSVTSAGIFVAVALVLSMYLIFEHLAAYNKPEEQKFLVGLILMVPVYGVESIYTNNMLWEELFNMHNHVVGGIVLLIAICVVQVEHVIREQNIMAANELIELFCELVVARLSIIAKQRECPPDLKEGISSLLFAGPRCSEIPELLSIRDVFQKKYGKDFVSTATDLRPTAGVNRLLIEKLSVKTPSGEVKLKVLKEIAKEYEVQWDTTETEEELLKPSEERIVCDNRGETGGIFVFRRSRS